MKTTEPGSEGPPSTETAKNNVLYPELTFLLRYTQTLARHLKAASKQFPKVLFLKLDFLILAQRSTTEHHPSPTLNFKNIVSNKSINSWGCNNIWGNCAGIFFLSTWCYLIVVRYVLPAVTWGWSYLKMYESSRDLPYSMLVGCHNSYQHSINTNTQTLRHIETQAISRKASFVCCKQL